MYSSKTVVYNSRQAVNLLTISAKMFIQYTEFFLFKQKNRVPFKEFPVSLHLFKQA